MITFKEFTVGNSKVPEIKLEFDKKRSKDDEDKQKKADKQAKASAFLNLNRKVTFKDVS